MNEEVKHEFYLLEDKLLEKDENLYGAELCEFVDANGIKEVLVQFTIGMTPDESEELFNLPGYRHAFKIPTCFEFQLTKSDLNKLNDIVNNYEIQIK